MRWAHSTLSRQTGCDEKTATLLVSTIGCRMVPILIMALAVVMTLEDLEIVSEVQVDEKIIPAIADLGVPLVLGRQEQWKTRMFSCHLEN